MSKQAPSHDIELDDRFLIDSDEESTEQKGDSPTTDLSSSKRTKLDVKYEDENASEAFEPLLDTGTAVDKGTPSRWQADTKTSHSASCVYIRKHAYKFVILGLATFLLLASGFVFYQKHNTNQAVRISSHWKGFDKIENWFVFGDSWTSTDFDTYGPQPSQDNPFGNPDVAGRDIYNYVGYLTLKYNHSFIKTRDLGWSASTIDATYDRSFLEWLDFAHQLHDSFEQHYVVNDSGILSGKEWNSDNTLFSTFFGINDVLVFNKTNPQWDKVFESYANFLGELYDASARNFLIINIPPLQHAPTIPGDKSKDNPAFIAIVHNFNKMLQDLVQHLMDKYDDVTVFSFDLYSLFQQIIDDPKSIPQTAGIKDTKHVCEAYKGLPPWSNPPMNLTKSCRGLTLNELLWHDELHSTDPAHEAIAANIEQLLMKYTPAST